MLSSGKTAIITGTSAEELSEPETTYNFEVRDFHTYYVGKQSVLVHNFCEKANADYVVKYKENGRTYKAYHQKTGINPATNEPYAHAGKFIARDNFGHGGSKFKLLEEIGGSKLRLIGDLNANGVLMTAKHSSNFGNIYPFFGRLTL